ncbi:retropepsin-like aspartic protease [Klebsiella pneumoniae]|uniref:retropepsin-like aspartic protease n=1 Tax=Klebsiella pneumoniae TaxID=573 RepID=UPI00203A4DDA|nr:retropepsin-like aspartic protease [Klebsiella pneumoniae]USB59546.1 retropepsin-like domain-containing protein [Klebsiella pneumoniae]
MFDDDQLKSLSKNDIALLTLMSSFGTAQPYRLDWKADKAVLPFISMNNLPVVSVMVNGQPVNVFIDTGADLFVIKSEMAKTLGLTSQASFTGTYAGGKTAEINHSGLQTLGLGDVTLHDVPVDIADFPESWVFTDERTGKKNRYRRYFIHGCISSVSHHDGLSRAAVGADAQKENQSA